MLNPSPLGEGSYDTFDYVDYLFVNEKEAAKLSGMPEEEAAALIAAGDYGEVAKGVKAA